MTIDTGAAVTVCPKGEFGEFPVEEGAGKKAGVSYRSASGGRMENEGEKKVKFHTEEGHKRGITFQVCDCTKPLISAAEIVAAGNRIVLDSNGSFIENKRTGQKTKLIKENGVFVMNTWVPECRGEGGQGRAGFARQGAA